MGWSLELYYPIEQSRERTSRTSSRVCSKIECLVSIPVLWLIFHDFSPILQSWHRLNYPPYLVKPNWCNDALPKNLKIPPSQGILTRICPKKIPRNSWYGCGSQWKTDVGPQMWMSSLVLTIQLLGYLILTHTHILKIHGEIRPVWCNPTESADSWDSVKDTAGTA